MNTLRDTVLVLIAAAVIAVLLYVGNVMALTVAG